MKDVMGLGGYGESHVFPVFQRMISDYYKYTKNFSGNKEVTAHHLDVGSFKAALFKYVNDMYTNVHKGSSWVDKTPGGEAIQGVPVILEAFPSAKIILPRRTGTETVTSIVKKFSVPFADACTIWDVAAKESIALRKLGLDVLELDQFDMTNKPEEVGEKLASYIGYPDKSAQMARFFAGKRTDQLSSHDWTRRTTLRDTDWSESDKRKFVNICGQSMYSLGYPL
jgi:hypothetical protein